MANRLRVHDPDFTPEDLNDPTNDPQWLQELTSNYQKLHLNKLWYLLPPNAQSNQPQKTDLNVVTKSEPQTNITFNELNPDNIKLQEVTPVPQESQYPIQVDQQESHMNGLSNNLNSLNLNEPSAHDSAAPSYNIERQDTMQFFPNINSSQQQLNQNSYSNINAFQEQPNQFNQDTQQSYSTNNQQVSSNIY